MARCCATNITRCLVLEINNKVGINGILTEAQRGAIDEATHQLSDSGDYAVAFAYVSGFMEDLGMFVKDRLSAMDSGHREIFLLLSASAILELVDGITAVVAEILLRLSAAPQGAP
jgi:hypothetical protein